MVDFSKETKNEQESNKSINKNVNNIPEINIGIVGHVDHGKTTLTLALTGKWTDTHSEEMKRGITIRLGYADISFYYCKKCDRYSIKDKCISCFRGAEYTRTISLIDAPGHETLMATVLSGTALMDAAILVISADEKCPQPQTAEHLKALDIAGIKNIIIAQNKVDLVDEQIALANYKEIKEFVKSTVAENAPIIPISAAHNVNISALIAAIEKIAPAVKRNLENLPRFYIARSFDINKPGTEIDELKGGVIGGSVSYGIIKQGDEITILPGAKDEKTGKYTTLKTKVVEIIQGGSVREKAVPGGLVAIQTELDPSLTKGDSMSGYIAGYEESLPALSYAIRFRINLFDHAIGIRNSQSIEKLKTGDALMITAAIAKTVGVITSAAGNNIEMKLKIPLAIEKDDKIAISKQIGGRWHLIGWGEIV